MPLGPKDWEKARKALADLIHKRHVPARGEDMAGGHLSDGLELALTEGLKAGAFFTASEYPALCAYAASANAKERGEVCIVLPILDSENILRLIPESIRSFAGEFITLACVDISPRSAFLLASNLPLQKSAQDMLKDNGLSIQALSLREMLYAVRRTSRRITKKDF